MLFHSINNILFFFLLLFYFLNILCALTFFLNTGSQLNFQILPWGSVTRRSWFLFLLIQRSRPPVRGKKAGKIPWPKWDSSTQPLKPSPASRGQFYLKELGGRDSGALLVEVGKRWRCSSRGVKGRLVPRDLRDDRASWIIWELVALFSGGL